MRRAIAWLWTRGIVGTFVAGLFAILPMVLTIWIMGWAGEKLRQTLGPQTNIGRWLQNLGMQFVGNRAFAYVLGWSLVLVGVWLIGFLVRSTARLSLQRWLDDFMKRLPLVKSVYGPISQVVSMLQQQDRGDVSGMPVVYCWFGEPEGGGFLGLLVSHETFAFGQQRCKLVYIPTSPLPMSGCILFVPESRVKIVEMETEQLMQIYFSLGVMASGAVPAKYQAAHNLP